MSATLQSDSGDNGGSGEVHIPEPRYLVVGRILRPHGVRGELRVEVITGYPERLEQHRFFYLAAQDSPESVQRYPVEKSRLRGKVILLKLGGYDDRNAAEALRGMLVLIPIDEAAPLEEGEYYHFQIVGLAVETETGHPLGRVVGVLETGANDVYVVHGSLGEVLVPAIEEVVLEINPEAGRMVVHVLPGMLAEDGG